jgi:hypothetical protein
MPAEPNWKQLFEAELQAAETARAAGKEGMARVCARRAAGIVVGQYFQSTGIAFANPSAVDRLKYLKQIPGIPPVALQAARRLLLRVTPKYTLPEEADLLLEARRLAQALLSE